MDVLKLPARNGDSGTVDCSSDGPTIRDKLQRWTRLLRRGLTATASMLTPSFLLRCN
jgi:hypothetical protein